MKTKIQQNDTVKKVIFIGFALACFTPLVAPPLALLLGFILSMVMGHPFQHLNHKSTKILLQASIVGLGFGMNFYSALEVGKEGLVFTIASIFVTLAVGLLLGRIFKIRKKTSVLIAAGTAICGGSAIAAMTPVIDAKENDTSVALAVIFILNSVALFLFPVVGHYLGLSQSQFGLWSAIAIHDTSSVVGAAQRYGETALQIATTVKLERALWIVPVSLLAAVLFKNKKSKITIPYFILIFVVAMVINTFVPQLQFINEGIVAVAKKCLTLTLFLIGAGLTRESLKAVGFRPMLQAVVLWVFISLVSLLTILQMTH